MGGAGTSDDPTGEVQVLLRQLRHCSGTRSSTAGLSWPGAPGHLGAEAAAAVTRDGAPDGLAGRTVRQFGGVGVGRQASQPPEAVVLQHKRPLRIRDAPPQHARVRVFFLFFFLRACAFGCTICARCCVLAVGDWRGTRGAPGGWSSGCRPASGTSLPRTPCR